MPGNKPSESSSTHQARAWHVIMANGGDETIIAHDCHIFSGVLAFLNHISPDDFVLVRAFAPQAWRDADLVDTPYGPDVHLRRPPNLVDHRPRG